MGVQMMWVQVLVLLAPWLLVAWLREAARCLIRRVGSCAQVEVDGTAVALGAPDVAEILAEVEVGLLDRLEVLQLQLDDGGLVNLAVDVECAALRVELGQGQRRLARVADLSAVPPVIQMLLEVLQSKVFDGGSVEVDAPALLFEALLYEIKVELEHLERLDLVQRRVVQAHVDSGGKGLVKVSDAVRGEKENTGVVL